LISVTPFSHDITFSEELTSALLKNPVLGEKLATAAVKLHELRKESSRKQYELLTYYEERDAGYKTGAAAFFNQSKELIRRRDTPASILLLAVKNVLGPAVGAWEPDSIWHELDKENVKVPRVNRDKILAAFTLTEVPAFYWEVNTFMNTVMAFNNTVSNTSRIHEASPGEISWAVYEAEVVLHEHGQFEPEFDHEPITYTAEVCHRAGLILAPRMLTFCQEALDKRNCDGAKVDKEQVTAAWDKLVKTNLAGQKFPDSPLGVQLARLASVEVYLEEKVAKYFSLFKELA